MANEDLQDRLREKELEIADLRARLRESEAAYSHLLEDYRAAIKEYDEFESNFYALADSVPVMIYVSRPQENRFLYVNEAFESITGYTRSEVMAGKITDLIHSDYRLLIDSRGKARIRGEEVPARYDLKMVTKQGEERILHLVARRIEMRGRPAVTGACFDITEQRKAEELLRQNQKLEALGMLAGGIAHDFNNILAIILACTEQARAASSPEHEAQPLLWEIIRVSMQARQLISKLLAFSRIQEEHYEEVDVKRLVSDTLDMLRPYLAANIRIERESSPCSGVVHGDYAGLQQVVMNLCINAERAMEDKGGLLKVQTSELIMDLPVAGQEGQFESQRCLRLAISDTGHGMDELTMKQMFNPFFTTRQEKGNTGLGLSVVQGIVKQHGGLIQVNSHPGEGSCFEIFLPLSCAAVESPAENTLEPLPEEPVHAVVMLIDDEPLLTKITAHMLQRLGYEVHPFTEARRALTALEKNPDGFDLVITDQFMTDMNGLDMIHGIRQITPEMPVILCTGHSQELTYEKVSGLKIAQILQKPLLGTDYDRAIKTVMKSRTLQNELTISESPLPVAGEWEPSQSETREWEAPEAGVIQKRDEPAPLLNIERLNIMEAVITGMAHEIRQVLSTIAMASSEALYWQEKGRPGTVQELMEDMETIVRRCQRIDDLLVYTTSFVYRDANAVRRWFDLNELLGRILKLVSSRMMAHGIGLQYTLEEEPSWINAFPEEIEDGIVLLSHDLSKAAVGLPPGSIKVSLSTRPDSDAGLELSIHSTVLSAVELEKICSRALPIIDGSAESQVSHREHELVVKFLLNKSADLPIGESPARPEKR